jgi:predicted Zn-dependent protease
MKTRALLFSSVLAFAIVALPACAQQSSEQKPADQTPAAQQTPAVQQTPAQPTPAVQQPSAPQQTPAGPQTPAVQQPSATQQTPDVQPAAPQTPTATPDDTQDQKPTNDPHPKHDGSKKDVDAIGNRKVGGLDWYSIEKEIRMGKEYAQQVEQTVKLIQDPVITEYVNRVGQNLVRNSDAKVPFTIKVIDSDEVNAFALPGGFFYVNSGLILAADEESELAGVMAHEIAHVAARHATRGQTRADIANIATIPLIFIGGGIGYAARQVAGIGLPLTFLSFSRGFESEADYLGLQYMYKAGYDPNSFVSFFEKLEAQEKKKPGSLAKAFRTHPLTPDRIQKTQSEIATILPARDQYIVTTSEFDQVKARLAALENRRRLDDLKQDKNKPTLRRTASNGPGKDDPNAKDDDRPTLKRRD